MCRVLEFNYNVYNKIIVLSLVFRCQLERITILIAIANLKSVEALLLR